MRVMLYQAAQIMLRSKKWSWLKAWAIQIARRRGVKKAIVALARRLAVIMHRILVDGTEFPGDQGAGRGGSVNPRNHCDLEGIVVCVWSGASRLLEPRRDKVRPRYRGWER